MIILKLIKNNEHGSANLTFIFIIIIIISAFLFTTGYKKNAQNNPGDFFTPDTSTDQSKNDTLQLRTITFKPKPQSTFDCNEKQLRTSSEPQILYAMSPDPGTNIGAGGALKLWYNDEHALTLGVGSVSDNTSRHVISPNINIGDPLAKDPNNFPYFPSLFLTDITSNPSDTSGDAEKGGTPIPPNEIWGDWKPKGGANPSPPNNTILPPGADPFPPVSNIKFGDGRRRIRETEYGAEIIWKVDSLNLIPGHSYRAQFIIHDGDREGDIGEGCTTIKL